MKRRSLWLAGTGAAAVAAGVGFKLWRTEQEAQALEQATGGLWELQFPQPNGPDLVMARFKGRPLVLNFWATWCAPCVKELPEIDRFHRDFSARGWQVIGLAVDNPQPVREFLKRLPVSFAVGLAGFEGADLGRRLGNSAGALPFTVVLGPEGRVRQRKLGATSYQELAGWAGNA